MPAMPMLFSKLRDPREPAHHLSAAVLIRGSSAVTRTGIDFAAGVPLFSP